jgi:hypothetical protein
MREYLGDEDFGQLAAVVLAAHWTAAHEPSDGRRLPGGVDFSKIEGKREARAAVPDATSAEADAIFSVIEPLVSDGATEDQKKHAVALGIVAARLPHGRREATIRKLLSLAPRRSRAALLLNLVLSGEIIEIEMVKDGIAEVLEAGKTQRWILSEGHELKEWLRLLPFVSRPAEALAVVSQFPDAQHRPDLLEEMVGAFGWAPGEEAENALFQLAKDKPKLYGNSTWRNAAMHRSTLSSARRFVDLAASGELEGRRNMHGDTVREIVGLLGERPELRARVYELLKDGVRSPGFDILARVVAESPDTEGLLLLVKIESEHNRRFISWRTVQSVVTEHVPSESWKGAYEVVPIAAVELRQKLLAMITDAGPADAAARCLTLIDKTRDEHDRPESEPRHPDLGSGTPWPIMIRNPDASEAA